MFSLRQALATSWAYHNSVRLTQVLGARAQQRTVRNAVSSIPQTARVKGSTKRDRYSKQVHRASANTKFILRSVTLHATGGRERLWLGKGDGNPFARSSPVSRGFIELDERYLQ